MHIASTIKSTKLQTPKATKKAAPTEAKGQESGVPSDALDVDFKRGEVKIEKGYNDEVVEVDKGAPFSHYAIAGLGALGAIGCAAKVGAHILNQPTLGGKVAAGALVLGAGFAGYAAADFGSGVFHHFIDNYPKKPDTAKPGELTWDTPVIGDVAAEFQVHHHFARDLEKVPLVSNIYAGGRIMAPAMLALAAFSPSPALTAAGGMFFGGAMMAQGSHRWAHMPKPPKIAKFMQKIGMAQSVEDHYIHHKMPWSDNYCIVNGMFNPVLTKNDFWRKWECAIFKATGAEPNSWRDPGVKELALGDISKEEFLERRREDKKVFRTKVKDANERQALAARLEGREDLTKNHAPK